MRIVNAARPRRDGPNWVHYKYRDASGRVIFDKVRVPKPDGGKGFLYCYQGSGWAKGIPFWGKPPWADSYLYNVPELLQAKESGADIWWCEGEKDADRLEEEDVTTTSHHGGAGHINAAQAEWFRGHTGRVILLMDLDEDGPTGANPGAYDVIRRYDLLLAVGITREQIRVAAPKVGKDIYDHLVAGRTLDELVWVTDLRPLRDKAERGNGFAGSGYPQADPEMEEALAQIEREGWKVRRG